MTRLRGPALPVFLIALSCCSTAIEACGDASPPILCAEMAKFCGSAEFAHVAKLACAQTCGACTTTTTTTSSPVVLEYCDEDEEYIYSPDTGKCYETFGLALNWKTSNNYCKHKGSLLLLKDPAATAAVLKLFRAANLADKNYHIGLRWDESSRAWLWTDGTPAHHTAWDWGEPVREDDHYRVYDGTGDHDCVYAVLRGEGIKWRTVPCDRERDDVQRGVCEVDRSRVD